LILATQFVTNLTVASYQESGINVQARLNDSAGTLAPLIISPEELRQVGISKPMFPSSAVINGKYPQIIKMAPLYEISREAEEFIFKQKKAISYKKDLITICDRIAKFLQNANMEAKISISLFQDPEYSDWVESKIVVAVNEKKFAKAYSLYGELLDHSLKKIKRRTIEKVVISIGKR